MSRLNNRAARIRINRWLLHTNRPALPETIPYLDAANRLRAEFDPTTPRFWERPPAVEYMRRFARSIDDQNDRGGLNV